MKASTSHLFAVALLATVSLLLCGCGLTQGKAAAEAVLARHFQTIATTGFDTAISDYGTQFFQKPTKDEWAKALAGTSRKLGTYQSHTVTGWRTFTQAGTSGAGTTVSLQCQVTYSKHSATESFTLFKGVGDSDYKIIGHQVNSTALMTEWLTFTAANARVTSRFRNAPMEEEYRRKKVNSRHHN